MKKTIIISALGEKSFTGEQLDRLKKYDGIDFYASIVEITPDQFVNLVRDYDIIAVTRRAIKELDTALLLKLPNLKHLVVFSTGYEWLDIEYLAKNDILLSYLPDYSTIAVAEHTMAFILTFASRLHLCTMSIEGRLPKWVSLRGNQLAGKYLGIIGFGKIGSRVADYAKTFGLHVSFYDIDPSSQNHSWYKDRESLLRMADYIVITANKVRNAPPLIGAAEISLMKQGVYLINPARWNLVDNQAVLASIKSGKIGGYAADDAIPLFLNDPELEPGRIIQSGHNAWYTTEAIQKGMELWTENIIGAITGNPRNLVVKGVE